MERVFDICHGCRRCFSLCNSFPTLFDAIDESDTMEVDGVPKEVYWKVVDHCYLCDMCYMTKCPYVPPHEFNVDFPHLMLRAKAAASAARARRSATVSLVPPTRSAHSPGIPVVSQIVNAVNHASRPQTAGEDAGCGSDRAGADYHARSLRKRLKAHRSEAKPEAMPVPGGVSSCLPPATATATSRTVGEDLVAVFEHNGDPGPAC